MMNKTVPKPALHAGIAKIGPMARIRRHLDEGLSLDVERQIAATAAIGAYGPHLSQLIPRNRKCHVLFHQGTGGTTVYTCPAGGASFVYVDHKVQGQSVFVEFCGTYLHRLVFTTGLTPLAKDAFVRIDGDEGMTVIYVILGDCWPLQNRKIYIIRYGKPAELAFGYSDTAAAQASSCLSKSHIFGKI